MSHLIFSHAKTIRKKALKAQQDAKDMIERIERIDIDVDDHLRQVYESVVAVERAEFKEVLRIAADLHKDYQEISAVATNNWYLITIRPDEQKITFEAFFNKVVKFMKRAFWLEWTLTFEQKGINSDELGRGFHVHIVANTKHRSKSECLRDTLSSFKDVTAENCIDVKTCRTPTEVINKYMIAYESDDGHKAVTKDADATWRSRLGLLPVYTHGEPLSIKSGQTGVLITEL